MYSIHRAITTRKRHLLRPILLLQSHYATKAASETTAKPKTPNTYTIATPRFTTTPPPEQPPCKIALPRPSEVPFQPKVANSVRLVGHVQTPLKSLATHDGNFFATTILTSSSSSSAKSFRIPLIFEGDLAHIASLHLKDNDFVFVAGSLRSDLHQLNASEGLTRLQVMVDTLNFVQGSSEVNKSSKDDRQEKTTIDPPASSKNPGDSTLGSWDDLVDNPKEWLDYRIQKVNALVNPKHPDFKRKDGNYPLWLNNSAPQSILSKLEGMEFDVPIQKSNQVKGSRDEFWKDLLENPDKWWDNRLNKRTQKTPDFKHKETGEPLWLSSSPAWVLPKLQPVIAQQDGKMGNTDTPIA